MTLGDRLKSLRNEPGISQGELERRTGLLRSYISRVENGHTVPSVDTLVKMARALEGDADRKLLLLVAHRLIRRHKA